MAVQGLTGDLSRPIGAVGFSMGASWALWLSARAPALVGATVAYYGTQNVDFVDSQAAYQGHFAEFDALVGEDEVVELEAHLRLAGRDTEFWRYPSTSHWFVEEDRELAYQPDAASLAWERTLAFLTRHLNPDRRWPGVRMAWCREWPGAAKRPDQAKQRTGRRSRATNRVVTAAWALCPTSY